MKAASFYECRKCGHQWTVTPSTFVSGCPVKNCRHRDIKYLGGRWVYMDEPEYERIPKYWEVQHVGCDAIAVPPKQRRLNLSNRISRKGGMG